MNKQFFTSIILTKFLEIIKYLVKIIRILKIEMIKQNIDGINYLNRHHIINEANL